MACLLVLQAAGVASARVRLDSAVPRGGGVVDLVLALDRGCSGTPTTVVSTVLPDGAAVVAVEDPPGWSHEVGAGEVRWSGPRIGPRDRARLVITARVDALPGDNVLLPTEQGCADGSSVSWTGEAEADPRPAPRFVATAATVDPTARPIAPEVSSSGAGPVRVAIGVIAAILVAAAAALLRRRAG